MKQYDLALIGGGIVGIATARALQRRFRNAAILLVEKETDLARHQTGHNSGVIHAGVYYAPGSLKAEFCREGAARTIAFCQEHNLPYLQCGKLLVATDAVEFERMGALEERCRLNRIEVHRFSEEDLKRREPRIEGVGALYVPATGITDYPKICSRMADEFRTMGGKILCGTPVTGIEENREGVRIRIGRDAAFAGAVIACGGLGADRLARMMGIDIDFRIIPFRGEYYRLPPRHNGIVRHLIYPIPDPDLPFLGVHLTRMIDGSVTVGPNAVLGWKREGYGRVNIDLRDSLDMLGFRGFWRLAKEHLHSGLGEVRDSLWRAGYLRRVQKYCPGLQLSDLRPYPAGIRAQAVRQDGSLIHDFLFAETERSLHVCNAPSPAATSAIPIGEYLCGKAAEKFRL